MRQGGPHAAAQHRPIDPPPRWVEGPSSARFLVHCRMRASRMYGLFRPIQWRWNWSRGEFPHFLALGFGSVQTPGRRWWLVNLWLMPAQIRIKENAMEAPVPNPKARPGRASRFCEVTHTVCVASVASEQALRRDRLGHEGALRTGGEA